MVRYSRPRACSSRGPYNPGELSLTPGARLGPYEIVAPLGRGGMGEVYRARDATLQRDVAIKILPHGFGADTDRVARFDEKPRCSRP